MSNRDVILACFVERHEAICADPRLDENARRARIRELDEWYHERLKAV